MYQVKNKTVLKNVADKHCKSTHLWPPFHIQWTSFGKAAEFHGIKTTRCSTLLDEGALS